MNPYCFLFVRQNISLAAQIIQTNHATFEMAQALPKSADLVTPSIVLVGVPDQKALEKVIRKLKLNRIAASAFYEGDDDLGLTAVATVPLTEEQHAILENYKLWKENNVTYALSSVARALASQEVGGRRFESFSAYHTPVAQQKEQQRKLEMQVQSLPGVPIPLVLP